MRNDTHLNKARLWTVAGATAIAAMLAPPVAHAGPEDDTLRIAWGSTGPIDNLDAYFNTNRTGIWFARNVWDTLVFRDLENSSYEPLLATSWSFPDDTTMELTLREGVTFHNGEPFNADDVVFTLNFIADPENGVLTQNNVDWIQSAERTGDYSVRINMTRPMPQIFELLSGPIVMYPMSTMPRLGHRA